MFYDHFLDHRYGASASTDGYHWEVITNQIEFPEGARHGNVFLVDDSIGKNLMKTFG